MKKINIKDTELKDYTNWIFTAIAFGGLLLMAINSIASRKPVDAVEVVEVVKVYSHEVAEMQPVNVYKIS